MASSEEVLTVAEAARRYNFSPHNLRQRAAMGGFPGAYRVETEAGSEWMIPASVFDALGYRTMARAGQPGGGEAEPPVNEPPPVVTREELEAALAGLERERAELADQRAAVERLVAEQEAARHEIELEEASVEAKIERLQAERDRLAAEREQLEAEREQLAADREQVAAEREELAADREQLRVDQAELRRQRRSRARGSRTAGTATARGEEPSSRPARPARRGWGSREPAERRRPSAVIWVEPDGGVCPTSHPVKAKVGPRLFRVPGMPAYERTRPDRCYRDEESATADGLTRARR